MMTNNSNKKQFILGGLFHLVMSVTIAIISYKISQFFIHDKIKSIPWGVISILLLPTGYGVTFLTKLSEVKKNTVELLNRSETRHLDIIIKYKKRGAYLTLCFQLIIVAGNIFFSVGSLPENLQQYHKDLLCLLIALTVTSLYLILPFLLGVNEVNDFESKVKERKSRKKKKEELLKKLKSDK